MKQIKWEKLGNKYDCQAKVGWVTMKCYSWLTSYGTRRWSSHAIFPGYYLLFGSRRKSLQKAQEDITALTIQKLFDYHKAQTDQMEKFGITEEVE